MIIKQIITSLAPVPLFYLIYFRYFKFKQDFIKHLLSFLSGIVFALFLFLVFLLVRPEITSTTAASLGFIAAALVEKAGAFAILYFILSRFRNFTVIESTLYAVLFGMGFSAVENVFYATAYGYSVLLARILFSVPLHLTTCGILGFYLGMSKLCETRMLKISYAVKAFLLSFILHGIFDTVLVMGGYLSYLAAPQVILMVLILELLLARSLTIQPMEIIKAQKLRFDDWLSLYRQPSYERWILQSMGTPGSEQVHIFLWRPGVFRFVMVLLFMALAIAGLSFQPELIAYFKINLNKSEQIILLGIFPLSISLMIILVGAINPFFFKKSKIKIPIIFDVNTFNKDGNFEVLTTYEINTANCFLKTSESLGIGSEIEIEFESKNFTSGRLTASVIWENHSNIQEAIGTIIRIDNPDASFLRFYIRYYFFRLRKGLAFLFKLPGFESTRRLFMRPISTMQGEKFIKRGTVIFREGEKGREFFLIKKGRVIFYKKKEPEGIITMDTAEPGEIFGEMSLLGNKTRALSAMTLTDCVLAAADKENIDALIINNFEFAQGLIMTLSERVKISEEILVEGIQNLEQRHRDHLMLFNAAMLILLSGMGHNVEDKTMTLEVKLDRALALASGMDKNSAANIIRAALSHDFLASGIDSETAYEIVELARKLKKSYRLKIKI